MIIRKLAPYENSRYTVIPANIILEFIVGRSTVYYYQECATHTQYLVT